MRCPNGCPSHYTERDSMRAASECLKCGREWTDEEAVLEEAAMEMRAAERTGDISHAYSALAVARTKLYARIKVYEKRRREEAMRDGTTQTTQTTQEEAEARQLDLFDTGA